MGTTMIEPNFAIMGPKNPIWVAQNFTRFGPTNHTLPLGVFPGGFIDAASQVDPTTGEPPLPAFDQLPVSFSDILALWRVQNWRINGTLNFDPPDGSDLDPSSITLDDWDIVTTQSYPGTVCEARLIAGFTGFGPTLSSVFALNIGDDSNWSIILTIATLPIPFLQDDQLFLSLASGGGVGSQIFFNLTGPDGSSYSPFLYDTGPGDSGIAFTFLPIGKPGIKQTLWMAEGSGAISGNITITGDSADGFLGWGNRYSKSDGTPTT